MFEPIDRVMNMRQGGSAVAPRRTDIAGQDHMLSYITPQEAGILQLLGGSGQPGPMGIPAFYSGSGQTSGFSGATTFGSDNAANNPAGVGQADIKSSFYTVISTVPGQDNQQITFGSPQDTPAKREQAGVPQSTNNTRKFAPVRYGPTVATPYSDQTGYTDALGNAVASPMSFEEGGAVNAGAPRRTDIGGQDHMLSYITPQEAGILQLLGGSGEPGPMGIPAFAPGVEKGLGGGGGSTSGGGGSTSGSSSGGGTSTTDYSGITDDENYAFTDDENYDQNLQQDIAMGNFASGGGDDRGFQYGNNYIGDGQYTGPRDSYANAMSGLAGLRDFYSDDRFGTDGTGLGLSQGAINATLGITNRNPYGYKGMFSRGRNGFDPRNIDYTDSMSEKNRRDIASNQFSKYANPQNTRGRLGFNRAFPDASVTDPGRLRAGLQPGLFNRSFETAYGPTTTYNVKRSPMDLLALSLIPGGAFLDQLTNKTGGVAPSELFDTASRNIGPLSGGQDTPGFRPADATATGEYSRFGSYGQGIDQGVGAVNSALEATKRALAQPSVFDNFKSKIMGIFEQAPAPVSTSALDFMAPGASPDLAGFENRFAPTAAAPTTETQQLMDVFGMGLPGVQSSLDPDRVMDALTGGIRGGIPTTVPNMTGEQLAGLLGENPKAAGFRDLEGMIKSVVDGENFPDDQNMYGPGMPDQTPLSPDELNNLLEPLGMELGRGSSTANQPFQVAGAFDDFGMALKSLGDDIVAIPGGYMDTKTGKTYSGTPGGSAKTFTGTRKKDVQPFSGESFLRNIGSMFNS